MAEPGRIASGAMDEQVSGSHSHAQTIALTTAQAQKVAATSSGPMWTEEL